MALDLFANHERSSNSSLFYRITSTSPRVFSIKLADLLSPDQNLSTVYYAESSINNGPFVAFQFDGSGLLSTNVVFDTTSPCVCSVSVNLSAQNELVDSYVLSGVFVDKFPSTDFIVYPSTYINEGTGAVVPLNAQTYTQSRGVYFYGEGHTEVINLSTAVTDPLIVSNWYVGNNINSIQNSTSVLETSATSLSTAVVRVRSSSGTRASHPVSLWLTNSSISTKGPFKTYDDETGAVSFYPFFCSTFNVNGTELRSTLRGNINVLLYPEATTPEFKSPFLSDSFTLPLDYSAQTFRGIIYDSSNSKILTETFVGTQWELDAVSEVGDWSALTPMLSSILAYQFQLAYDEGSSSVMLPTYKTSPSVPTTVFVGVSSHKNIVINKAPFDWTPRRSITTAGAIAQIGPYPVSKLYVPNFFNLRMQDVPVTIITVPEYPLEIKEFSVQSSHSSETLVLTASTTFLGASGIMHFDRIGSAELSATAVLRNTVSGSEQTVVRVYPGIAEIVDEYESIAEEKYFQTDLTPIELTYALEPKISPNEWAIADNVNEIIRKIFITVDELDQYTKLYQRKDVLHGWLGLTSSSSSVKASQPKAVWVDLECPAPANESTATWIQFECHEDTVPSVAQTSTWAYSECSVIQTDPSCLQKYCLEWKWKSRKYGANAINITWRSAKRQGEFPKKWMFEKCDIDSKQLNCAKDFWKISTIDFDSFPIPSHSYIARCSFVDVEVSSQTNQIVIAYPTEINLVNTNYEATVVARRGVADELFAFQSIVGITTNGEGKTIVLDGTLPRVSVFKIIDNSFVLFSTWGGPGLAANPTGFNQPQDIHVDSSNSVWIADTGNECVKKLTMIGKHLMTISSVKFKSNPPRSICVDSKSRVHCLTTQSVIVFDNEGQYLFEYKLPADVTGAKKINVSFNKEMTYITYDNGVIKYFRDGTISHYTLQNLMCRDGQTLVGYNSLSQDRFRNLYVTAGDKILKIADLQKRVETKAAIPSELDWTLNDLLVHKEEYIQPWVYLKSFHRLWDKIELLRNSLFYELTGCKSYSKPVFSKTDLVIGQNEIVSNAVINRLSGQLWTNLQSLIDYFDPSCEN